MDQGTIGDGSSDFHCLEESALDKENMDEDLRRSDKNEDSGIGKEEQTLKKISPGTLYCESFLSR